MINRMMDIVKETSKRNEYVAKVNAQSSKYCTQIVKVTC